MRGRDSNRINMIGSVIDYCEKNTSVTAGIAAFAVVLDTVKDKRMKIHELNQRDRNGSVGVTADLRDQRGRMCAQALKCASATIAYAYSIKDNALAALVDLTPDDLKLMDKETVASTCKRVHDTALAHVAQIASYGVTAADVTDLNAQITDYRLKSTDPRQAIISKGDANRQVKALVRDVLDNHFKNQLDHMVNTLRFVNPAFWSGYQMARNIIDLGIVHSKLKGVVLDVNNVPLTNVWVRAYEPNTKKLVKETSTVGGEFKISPMPVGYFDLVWELEGYVSKVESNTHIGAGKIVKRKVVLKK